MLATGALGIGGIRMLQFQPTRLYALLHRIHREGLRSPCARLASIVAPHTTVPNTTNVCAAHDGIQHYTCMYGVHISVTLGEKST